MQQNSSWGASPQAAAMGMGGYGGMAPMGGGMGGYTGY